MLSTKPGMQSMCNKWLLFLLLATQYMKINGDGDAVGGGGDGGNDGDGVMLMIMMTTTTMMVLLPSRDA